MPSVQRAYDAWNNTDVVILLISIDGGGEGTVKAFLTAHSYTVPSLLDPRMKVARKFGVRAVPTTYVVNRAGRVVAQGFGLIEFDSPEFGHYLQTLLAQPAG